MKFVIIFLCSCSAFAQSADPRLLGSPTSPFLAPAPNYQAPTGTQYQYDLNRQNDQIRYQNDQRAQQRDSLSVDPRRELDRDLGISGGGILRR